MPARNIYHNQVRNALIKDGWTITHDPLRLTWGDKDLYVDLGAERLLARDFPNIRVVGRRGGAFSSSGAQENTTALVSDYPGLNAVLGLTANATRGVHMALQSRSLRHDILIVGCEQDADLLNYVGADEISAIVAANTYRMAHEAVAEISEFQRGKPIPARIVAPPMLLTKQTLNSVEARPFISPLR